MLYQQIARNKRKTAFLLVIFVIILALVGGGAAIQTETTETQVL